MGFFEKLNADLLKQQAAIETEFRERPELTLEDIERKTACYEDFIRFRFREAAERGIAARAVVSPGG